jgi:TPR repeat protein
LPKPPAWLGLLEGLATPSPALAKVGQSADRQEIRLVLPGGPAEKAGLKRGDVLLEVDGRQVMDETASAAAVDGLKAGQTVRVVVLRGEQQVEMTATVQDRPDPQTLVETLRKLGDAGKPEAFTALGRLLVKGGHGVAKDEAEGVRWLRKAAEQGDAAGQAGLGAMWALGVNGVKDNAEALRWSRLAAEQGDAIAQSNLAHIYFEGCGVAKDDEEAFRWLRKSAERGYTPAQANLGEMYLHGVGVRQDDAEAVRWSRAAAEQGDAQGQSQLGVSYEQGQGVPKDEAEAARLYRLAAEQGFAQAQSNLGDFYERGGVVKKDEVEAVRLHRLAAA